MKLELAQQFLVDSSCTGVQVNLVNCSVADSTSRIDRQTEEDKGREIERCDFDSEVFLLLTLRRRIKSHLLFAGIIRSSPFSPR